MGIPINVGTALLPPAGDVADAVLQNTLTTTGTVGPFPVYGDFNVSVSGASTVAIEKTFNGGTTYIPVLLNTGAVLVLAGPAAISLYEPERGVSYIANVTTNAVTSVIRFSATGAGSKSQGWR